MLNPYARAFAYAYAYETRENPLEELQDRMNKCKISQKDQKIILPILNEWFSSSTLNNVLSRWETYSLQNTDRNQQQVLPLSFVLYNVRGFKARSLEVIDLIHQVNAAFAICTEVGKHGIKQKIPDFNTFYEKGTNKKGGVIIAAGKHLKATKVETNLRNTVVVDITGLNEPLRVIGVYWPISQKRNIDELLPFINNHTIIAGDFNATVCEWGSLTTDKRGEEIQK